MGTAAYRQPPIDIDEALAIIREMTLRDLRAQLANSKRLGGVRPAMLACFIVVGLDVGVVSFTATYAVIMAAGRASASACGR